MLTKHTFFYCIAFLLVISSVNLSALESDIVVGNGYHKALPRVICDKDFSHEKCLEIIGEYVAQKHVIKYRQYYKIIVDECLKVHGWDGKDAPSAKFYIVRKALFKHISDYWYKTAELPEINENVKSCYINII